MPVVFVDGISHYTTVAQGNTKYASTLAAPVAATGAFGTPGIQGSPYGNLNGAQYNFPASAQREFCMYFNAPAVAGNLWALFDNTFPQIYASLQVDGSILIHAGAIQAGGAYAGMPYPATLLGIIPANSVRFGVQQNHKVSVLHHATLGTLVYKIDGATVLTITGTGPSPKNTAPSGTAQSTILYQGVSNGHPSGYAPSTAIRSHILIADTIGDIVGLPRIGGLFPDGAGATTAWTTLVGAATHWQAVNETTPDDDTSYVASSTVGQTDTYSMQDTAANTGAISGLAVTIRIKKDDANSRFVAAVLRIGGVDYVHGTPQGVPGAYAYLQFIWSLNPATGTAFTKAVVDALEAGYKVTS